jgi:hypothetical protein
VATLFISHRFAEQPDADRLRQQLGSRWRILTHAVSREAAATWQEECRQLIQRADAVVCIVGDRTAESPNVDWELETALASGTEVIPVRAERSVAPALPASLVARRSGLLEAGDLPARLDEVAFERTG